MIHAKAHISESEWELEEQKKEAEMQKWVGSVRARMIQMVRWKTRNPRVIRRATKLAFDFGKDDDTEFNPNQETVQEGAIAVWREYRKQWQFFLPWYWGLRKVLFEIG
jgi:hypothetical protein